MPDDNNLYKELSDNQLKLIAKEVKTLSFPADTPMYHVQQQILTALKQRQITES